MDYQVQSQEGIIGSQTPTSGSGARYLNTELSSGSISGSYSIFVSHENSSLLTITVPYIQDTPFIVNSLFVFI